MTRRRAVVLLLIALVAAGAAVTLRELGVGRNLELETVDARFRVRGPQPPPKDVVLVQVDERSLSALQLRWPFPRSRDARVIDRLARAKAKVIAIDLQFTEPTKIDEDNALIESIDRADGVVLATTAVDDQGRTNVLGGDDVVNDIGARVGSALLPIDPDGALRRAAYSMEGLESFAVVTAEMATGRQIEPFDSGRTWIRYAGPPQTLRSYSFSDVLRGRVPESAFRDKIVVLGTEALRLKDASTTSTTNGTVMSGPEVQANAIATVLAGLPLTSTGGAVALLLIVLLAAVAPVAALRFGVLGAAIAAALAAVALAAGAQLLFGTGLIVPVVHPLAACVLALLGVLAVPRPRRAPATVPEDLVVPEADAEMAPTMADEIGGFQLEEVIGRGGMGVVYRALQPGLDRRVAVKVIAPEHAADPGFRERFTREARLAAAIDHPNIVPIHTAGDDHGQLYLAMRHVDGINLADRLRRGPIPRAAVAEIVRQVASALDAAHERGLIHRDVKPANILLAEREAAPPHVYLTDFGITRELTGPEAGLTRTGVFLGSIDYAAPEQADGAGPAADLYALGCVAYECLTGGPPFGRGRDVAVRWAHLNEEPRPPSELVPGLSPDVDDVLLRALAKDPDRRWADCDAFARRLAGALEGVGADQPLGT